MRMSSDFRRDTSVSWSPTRTGTCCVAATLVASLRVVHRSEDHLDDALLAAAHHGQVDSRADILLLENVHHRIQGLDSFAVDRNDQTADEEATAPCSPAGF